MINPEAHARRETAAMEIFDAANLMEPGHFVFVSGVHSDTYLRKERILARPGFTSGISFLMAEEMAETYEPEEVDVLAAYAPCASVLASRVAEYLGSFWGKTPEVIFAEKESVASLQHNVRDGYSLGVQENVVLKRGYDARIRGQGVHIVEDNVSTGSSVKTLREILDGIKDVRVAGASAMCLRSSGLVTAESLGVDNWMPLATMDLNIFPEGSCPMDADLQAHPVRTDVGHGAKWLAQQSH